MIQNLADAKVILNPMHDANQRLETTDSKGHASIRYSTLRKLVRHVPNVLLVEELEVIIIDKLRLHMARMLQVRNKSNGVQLKVDTHHLSDLIKDMNFCLLFMMMSRCHLDADVTS
jgi:ABC-type thiamine transport system ATPase subunit